MIPPRSINAVKTLPLGLRLQALQRLSTLPSLTSLINLNTVEMERAITAASFVRRGVHYRPTLYHLQARAPTTSKKMLKEMTFKFGLRTIVSAQTPRQYVATVRRRKRRFGDETERED
jgi:hypothetical protein